MRRHRTRSDYEGRLAVAGRISGKKHNSRRSHAWLIANGWYNENDTPHTRRALDFISEHIPGFGWSMVTGSNGSQCVLPRGYPHIDGEHPSLADLVRHCTGEYPLRFDTISEYTRRHAAAVLAVPNVGEQFARLMEQRCHLPPSSVMEAVGNWLCRAKNGEPSLVFAGVCPDWTTSCGRYTFAGLGDSVGLVAQRFLAALPDFASCLAPCDVRFVAAIGDFEGDSDDTLRRLGITRDEFRRRCEASQEAFLEAVTTAKQASLRDRVSAPLATDFVGGSDAWRQLLRMASRRIEQHGLAAAHGVSDAHLSRILAARASLYKRWHGDDVDVAEVFAAQAPEYGAMGLAARRACDNVLVVGADAVAMAQSFQLLMPPDRPLPVISLRAPEY